MWPDQVSNPGPLTYFDRPWYKYKALLGSLDKSSTLTLPRIFTELCPFANFNIQQASAQ